MEAPKRLSVRRTALRQTQRALDVKQRQSVALSCEGAHTPRGCRLRSLQAAEIVSARSYDFRPHGIFGTHNLGVRDWRALRGPRLHPAITGPNKPANAAAMINTANILVGRSMRP